MNSSFAWLGSKSKDVFQKACDGVTSVFSNKIEDGSIEIEAESKVTLFQWKLLTEDKKHCAFHYCIRVFHKFYEFTPPGIQITARNRTKCKSITSLGATQMIKDDFETWIFEQNDKYNESTWNMENHNSFHFAKHCCDTLGVELNKEMLVQTVADLSKDKRGTLTAQQYSLQVNSFSESNMFRSF